MRKAVGTLQNDPHVSLLKCPACHAASASHYPSLRRLDDYYEETFPKYFELFHEHQGEADVMLAEPDRFADHLAKLLPLEKLRRSASRRIVDFGGANGTFAVLLAERLAPARVEVTVVDFGDKIAKTRNPNIRISKVESLDDVVTTADIVIASASLEHVTHVKKTVEMLLRLLKSDGYLYARSPYVEPLKKIFPSFDMGFPAHLHDLGPGYWTRFAKTYDTDVEIVSSGPGIAQLTMSVSPVRGAISFVLKLPGRLESALFPRKKWLLWPFVGAWEVLLHRPESAAGNA